MFVSHLMVMRKTLVLTALVLLINFLQAQTIILGVVRDSKTNPVPGASISIKDSYDGATTDSSGKFSFKTTEKGEQILVVTAVGYRGTEQKINLNGTTQTLLISLKEEINEMKAVVITAGSF